MANLRAGLIGLGMMGRHHARVLGGLEGVDLVAVADPGGDQARRRRRASAAEQHRGAHRRRHRLLHGRRPDHLPRAGRPGAGRGRRPRDDREAAGPGHPVGAQARRRVRRQRPGRGGRPHRALQPGAAVGPRPPRGRRAGRCLPGHHPTSGPVPGPHRRRGRGQGPGHPRHRPDRLGDAAAVRLGGRTHRHQERSRVRGPRRGHRSAGRRHRDQPPGQLAVAAEGAGHRSSPASAGRSWPTR